jgi:hypothetical protein
MLTRIYRRALDSCNGSLQKAVESFLHPRPSLAGRAARQPSSGAARKRQGPTGAASATGSASKGRDGGGGRGLIHDLFAKKARKN